MSGSRRYKGILYIVLSAFCFALMNLFVRLAGDLPSIQKSFFRNFVAAIFACVILLKDGVPFRCRKENLKFMLLRSVFGTLGILCNFYAVDHLVLADASMLNKMSPFFAVLFSFLILNEKVKVPQALMVAGKLLCYLDARKDNTIHRTGAATLLVEESPDWGGTAESVANPYEGLAEAS